MWASSSCSSLTAAFDLACIFRRLLEENQATVQRLQELVDLSFGRCLCRAQLYCRPKRKRTSVLKAGDSERSLCPRILERRLYEHLAGYTVKAFKGLQSPRHI